MPLHKARNSRKSIVTINGRSVLNLDNHTCDRPKGSEAGRMSRPSWQAYLATVRPPARPDRQASKRRLYPGRALIELCFIISLVREGCIQCGLFVVLGNSHCAPLPLSAEHFIRIPLTLYQLNRTCRTGCGHLLGFRATTTIEEATRVVILEVW